LSRIALWPGEKEAETPFPSPFQKRTKGGGKEGGSTDDLTTTYLGGGKKGRHTSRAGKEVKRARKKRGNWIRIVVATRTRKKM